MQVGFITARHPSAIVLVGAFAAEFKGALFSFCLGFIDTFGMS
jgi:hypothetical protein